MSSEIELAIKMGDVKLTDSIRGEIPPDVACFKYTLKHLNVDLERDALTDMSLSRVLRVLCTHQGDHSFDRLIDSVSWNKKEDVHMITSFFLGIGYLYPPSSLLSYISYTKMKEKLPQQYRNFEDLAEFYAVVRQMYQNSIN